MRLGGINLEKARGGLEKARGKIDLEKGRGKALQGARWLRSNSEHYLLLDAQARMAARYGRPAPPPPKGAQEVFWRKVFAPTYRRLPWKVRLAAIQRMPGSHRRDWSSRPVPTRRPAI
jgi:hypothetical protein